MAWLVPVNTTPNRGPHQRVVSHLPHISSRLRSLSCDRHRRPSWRRRAECTARRGPCTCDRVTGLGDLQGRPKKGPPRGWLCLGGDNSLPGIQRHGEFNYGEFNNMVMRWIQRWSSTIVTWLWLIIWWINVINDCINDCKVVYKPFISAGYKVVDEPFNSSSLYSYIYQN